MKQILELGLDRDMMTQIIISHSTETRNVTPYPAVQVSVDRVGLNQNRLLRTLFFGGKRI